MEALTTEEKAKFAAYLKENLRVEIRKEHGWFGALDLAVEIKLEDETISESKISMKDGSEENY